MGLRTLGKNLVEYSWVTDPFPPRDGFVFLGLSFMPFILKTKTEQNPPKGRMQHGPYKPTVQTGFTDR